MNKLLKEVQKNLDFLEAVSVASSPNDLLPSRFEDKVKGQLGKEFVVYLNKMITEEKYSPIRAEFIHILKPGFTTRPAALLTLEDRVVYEALVAKLKNAIDRKLISGSYIMWPRGNYVDKRWSEFERAPLSTRDEYIVNVDITAFYDSIDHSVLEHTITEITGEDIVASIISAFLTKIMGLSRGIPQGILASDTLATLYLQPVDSAMLRAGFNYWRHGDDIRISVKNISLARKAIATVETELRKIGLVLNSSKCQIQKAENYESYLQEINKAYELIKRKLYEEKVNDVSSDTDMLQELMDQAALAEQMKWDLFYHQSISVQEVIEEIREHLQPNEVAISIDLFSETISQMPDSDNPLPNDQFHVRIKKSLLRLAAGKSEVAIDNCAMLIAKFPEKTELVCNYLLSLTSEYSERVALQVENVINSDLFLTAWQKAWIYRVMIECADKLEENTLSNILYNCNNQYAHWLERVEGFKILSKINRLPFNLISNSWEIAPKAYRPDLILSAVYLESSNPQAKLFLEGIKQYPVERVVARHCKSKVETEQPSIQNCI